jgi:outer membrane lipoprotein SlyB
LTGVYFQLEEDLMKKILALVLALFLMAAMVFAEPVVLASGIIQTTDLFVEADLSDPLFTDNEAPQLAALEAEQVERDGGPITIGVCAVAGCIAGAYLAGRAQIASGNTGGNRVAVAIAGGAIAGMVVGAAFGARLPIPY